MDRVLTVCSAFTSVGCLTLDCVALAFIPLYTDDTLQGVFGSSELIHMTSRMQHKHHLSHKSDYPQHFKYTDTIEIVKSMIKKHLHVLICWSVDGSSSSVLLPLLCGAAGYSMYVPRLSIDSCSEIALHYLETYTEASWRDGIGFAGGCAALAELVSHIHITTVKASELVAARFVLTPRSLITCVEMGYNLSISLEEKEKVCVRVHVDIAKQYV